LKIAIKLAKRFLKAPNIKASNKLKMKTKSQSLFKLWQEARTRFSNQLPLLTEEDMKKKLPPSQNTVGFLLRHIADVELLFAKNVFGAMEVKVSAKTVMAQRDTGEWTDLAALLEYVSHSFKTLSSIIEKQKDGDWETIVETKEFGAKTKAEALGRIISHTAHHGGQIALLNKYGAK